MLVAKVRMKESKRKEGNERQEIENIRYYQKVPGLGEKKNSGITYSISLPSPLK